MRFFTDADNIDTTNKTVIINDKRDILHLSASLRLKPGDIITVCDGSGTDYACEALSVEKGRISFKIINSYPGSTEPSLKVSLFQGLPKSGKMDFIIEKCVELGVFEIYPVITQFTQGNRGLSANAKTERYARIAETAAKQCNREFIPRVSDTITFDAAITKMKESDIALVAWEKEQKARIRDYTKDFEGESASILIGPEGGFSDYEAATFRNAGLLTVKLGRRILRTETAGMTCLTILFNEMGEF